MKTMLIVWHSQTGGTAQMVEALAEGARSVEGVRVRALRAIDSTADVALAADAFVFATPECLAMLSGQLKDFFDRSYYALLDRVNGRAYATLVCAGSDGSNAVRQIERIATGLRLRKVADALIVNTAAQTPERILAPKHIAESELARCRELGALVANGVQLGLF
ncbi:MAG: flavodoxin family protein [Rhodanobacteraceae bacterium]|jgi:multimeric flavodoxin WrbA|nr:flavodoxin family protein [Rhodanobacteraceae bacterium]MBP7623986.1 flavodoxin family protein [Xanthomonadales bacterium]